MRPSSTILAAIDGAELSLGERMSNILIKAAGVPFITESHHRLALRLLLHGANPNRLSKWSPLHLAARARSGVRSSRLHAIAETS